MEIIEMNEIQGIINKRGVLVKQIIKHENTTVMNLCLKPGDEVPPHDVPVDVFFYIVEGKGTLRLGEEESVVKAKDIIVCPPNTKMSLKADQGEEFIVLNVKTPSI